MKIELTPRAIVVEYDWSGAKIVSTLEELNKVIDASIDLNYRIFTADDILNIYDSEDEPPADAINLYVTLKRIVSDRLDADVGYDPEADLGDLT